MGGPRPGPTGPRPKNGIVCMADYVRNTYFTKICNSIKTFWTAKNFEAHKVTVHFRFKEVCVCTTVLLPHRVAEHRLSHNSFLVKKNHMR